jgi:N-acetylglucosaminylphosphatidylinositol deacetylase
VRDGGFPGNADGLGHIRKEELQKSAVQLGLRNESDVFVLDDPTNFPDSMTTIWPAARIASLLVSAFAPELSPTSPQASSDAAPGSSSAKPASSSSSSSTVHRRNGSLTATFSDDAPQASIDVLLTFDQAGVSNHPNHRSLYDGAVSFMRILMKGKSGYACPVSLYTLTSTSILRKYAGVLDAPVTMLYGIMAGIMDKKKPSSSKKSGQGANRLLYVSGISEWLAAWKAMVYGHQSQMVWFRWGWITIGRYMVVNDLRRERI